MWSSPLPLVLVPQDVQVCIKLFIILHKGLSILSPGLWRPCSQWSKLSRGLRLVPMALVWTSLVRSWSSSWATWPMWLWPCTSVTPWASSPPMPRTGSPLLTPSRGLKLWLGGWAWGSKSYPTLWAFSLFPTCFVMLVPTEKIWKWRTAYNWICTYIHSGMIKVVNV